MTLTSKITNQLMKNRKVRIEVTRQDLSLFFSFYFTRYITHKIAPFQEEMLSILQNEKHKMVVFAAFRGSAKSTICSQVLPIWSIIGRFQCKNILLVSQTEQKAEKMLTDIRGMLESEMLLLDDHGTFYSRSYEWNRRALFIPKYNVRIIAISITESVRGIKNFEHRPDLIIYDDIEDTLSTRTQESRDKTWETLFREFVPLGTAKTRHIFVGNIVHNDSVIARLRTLIQSEKMTGIYREFPILIDGEIAWPGKFPNMEAVEELRRATTELFYLNEYMLQPTPEGGRLILPTDIRRYDVSELNPRADFVMYLILVDPAVSGEHIANRDKTAIIVLRIYGSSDNQKFYISPNPINAQLEWPKIIDKLKDIVASIGQSSYLICIEGGSSQKGLAQIIKDNEHLNVIDVPHGGNDKRTRLSMLKPWLTEKIVFPKSGTEILETQLIGFGTERHDDLVDALTLIPLAMPEIKTHVPCRARLKISDLYGRNYFVNRSEDWGDREDRKMFGGLGRGKWRRVLEIKS